MKEAVRVCNNRGFPQGQRGNQEETQKHHGSNQSCEEMMLRQHSCRASSKVNAPAQGEPSNFGSGDHVYYYGTATIVQWAEADECDVDCHHQLANWRAPWWKILFEHHSTFSLSQHLDTSPRWLVPNPLYVKGLKFRPILHGRWSRSGLIKSKFWGSKFYFNFGSHPVL